MFENLKTFFAGISDQNKETSFDQNDQRLATAALLAHAMVADGVMRDVERDAVSACLTQHYDLSEEELEILIAEGKKADSKSVDFYSFTSILRRDLDREGREKIVEMLWHVILADGVIHELEDNVVWRVAELLGIESRERILLRQKVEAALINE